MIIDFHTHVYHPDYRIEPFWQGRCPLTIEKVLEAQEAGLLWAPLRKPHENALDEHWLQRKTFANVPHPELGRSFLYPTSKWLATRTSRSSRPYAATAASAP